MKKTIISFASCMSFALAIAQIPNNGFENWTTVGSYSNPDSWGTMNNTTSLAGVYTATKGTPGSPGTSYLKLTSKTVTGFGVVNGIAVSGVLDSITMQPKSGFAYSGMPQSFTGKWQHMIYGTSQGALTVTLTRWDTVANQRETIAVANQTLSGMAMSWANFTINFVYQSTNLPDSCIIFLRASGSNPTDNDYLWVDNLAFTGSVLGVENAASITSDVSVFPNPGSEILNLTFIINSQQNIDVQIVSVDGRLVEQKKLGKVQGEIQHQFYIRNLSKGIYLVKIIGEEGVQTKQFVVE